MVVFLVADSGPGIPADHLERIFDPFHRVDSGLTRTVGGTGLGLAITRRILDAHHGTIGVESPPDGGTTFTVRLPVQLGAITAPA
jgi:signal transduction histidine kinase